MKVEKSEKISQNVNEQTEANSEALNCRSINLSWKNKADTHEQKVFLAQVY